MTTFGVNIAIMKDDKVLLTKRDDFPVWCLPGGSINSGETIAQAAIRETLEETGLDIAITHLVGLYSRPNWGVEGNHAVLFASEIVGGKLVKKTGETVDARFFSPDELPADLIWWHRQRVKDAFSGDIGFVRLQDAIWPYGDQSRADVEELIKSGKMSEQQLIDDICGEIGNRSELLEVPNRFIAR